MRLDAVSGNWLHGYACVYLFVCSVSRGWVSGAQRAARMRRGWRYLEKEAVEREHGVANARSPAATMLQPGTIKSSPLTLIPASEALPVFGASRSGLDPGALRSVLDPGASRSDLDPAALRSDLDPAAFHSRRGPEGLPVRSDPLASRLRPLLAAC